MSKIYQKMYPKYKSRAEGILDGFMYKAIPSCFCPASHSPVPKRAGFTLIELLVVVLIIGILAAVALPQYRVAVAKSRFVQLQVLGDAIYKAEAVYYMANGVYSNDFSNLVPNIPGTVSNGGKTVAYGNVSCHLLLGEGADGLDYSEYTCQYRTGAEVPFYVRKFESTYGLCRSSNLSESSVPAKVCLSLGGTSKSCSEKGYCQWRLP